MSAIDSTLLFVLCFILIVFVVIPAIYKKIVVAVPVDLKIKKVAGYTLLGVVCILIVGSLIIPAGSELAVKGEIGEDISPVTSSGNHTTSQPTGGYSTGLGSSGIDEEYGTGPNENAVAVLPDPSFNSIANDIKEKYEKGLVGYVVPDKMSVGENYTVEASVARSLDTQTIYQSLSTYNNDLDTIKVSTRMEMTLTDPAKENFTINALSSQRQLVDTNEATKWQWSVKPLNDGNNKLLLKAMVIVIAEGESIPKDWVVFDKAIIVETTLPGSIGRFIAANWQFLTPVIFIPLFLWSRRRFLDYVAERRQAAKNKKGVGFNLDRTEKDKNRSIV